MIKNIKTLFVLGLGLLISNCSKDNSVGITDKQGDSPVTAKNISSWYVKAQSPTENQVRGGWTKISPPSPSAPYGGTGWASTRNLWPCNDIECIRTSSAQLQYVWLNGSDNQWYYWPTGIGSNCTGRPAICQDRANGNLEVVVVETNTNGKLRRYTMEPDGAGYFRWVTKELVPTTNAVYPAMICNLFGNDLELVVKEGSQLAYYWRDNSSGTWQKYCNFGANVAGQPALVQKPDGNFHVVVRETGNKIRRYELVWEGSYVWKTREALSVVTDEYAEPPAMSLNEDNNRLNVVIPRGYSTYHPSNPHVNFDHYYINSTSQWILVSRKMTYTSDYIHWCSMVTRDMHHFYLIGLNGVSGGGYIGDAYKYDP